MVVGMNLGGYGSGDGFGFGFEWVALVVGGGGVGHTVAAAAARYVWWRSVGFCWVLGFLLGFRYAFCG